MVNASMNIPSAQILHVVAKRACDKPLLSKLQLSLLVLEEVQADVDRVPSISGNRILSGAA